MTVLNISLTLTPLSGIPNYLYKYLALRSPLTQCSNPFAK